MARRLSQLIPSILLLALAGCGGGSSTKTPAAPTSTARTTTPTAPSSTSAGPTSTLVNASPADASKAESLVLVPSDFPAGWTSTPHKQRSSSEETGSQLASCVGRPDPATYETADVHGADFQTGESRGALSVQSDAAFVTSRDEAQADYAAFQDPKLGTCFKTLISNSLQGSAAQGASVKSVTFDPQPLARPFADGTLKFRMTATVQGPNGEATVYIDFVVMLKDRAEVDATFETVGQPFPADLEDSLVTTLGRRLEAA